MVKVRRCRVSKNSEHKRPQDRYRDWLEHCQHYKVCAYCLKSYDSLEIEHYVPEKYALLQKKNPHLPSNLFLACHDCNFAKLDYHPKNDDRKMLRSIPKTFSVLNSFKHDYDQYYAIKDGYFTDKSNLSKSKRFCTISNIALFAFDLRHDVASFRANLIDSAIILENVVSQIPEGQVGLDPKIVRAAIGIWRNRIFFEAFGYELSPRLLSFAEREWQMFASNKMPSKL